MLASLEDLGQVAKGITGCIDSRGHVLDMASRELANVRQNLADVDERVQNVSKQLGHAIEVMARLDLVTAKARFSREYRMFAPDVNTDGRLWLRQARHPLLEHLFRTTSPERERGEADTTLTPGAPTEPRTV